MKSIIEISLETRMRLSEILRIDLDILESSKLVISMVKIKPRVTPLIKRAVNLIKNKFYHLRFLNGKLAKYLISYVKNMELKVLIFVIVEEVLLQIL